MTITCIYVLCRGVALFDEIGKSVNEKLIEFESSKRSSKIPVLNLERPDTAHNYLDFQTPTQGRGFTSQFVISVKAFLLHLVWYKH